MRHKKRTFLLLEILIALSLMATLVSVLFSFLIQSMKMERKMSEARVSLMERQNLQIRMQDLLTSLAAGGISAPLYTQKFPKEEYLSLIALYDNGIDPDPHFSGTVLGRIYVDEKGDLCLVYWPYENPLDHPLTNAEKKDRSWRKEVLFSNVSDLRLSFLNPDEKEYMHHTAKNKVLWERSWAKEKKGPPSIVRLEIKQKDQKLEFAFRLPNTHPIPTYFDRSVKV